MIALPNTSGTGINCGSGSIYGGQSFTIACWIRRQGTGTTVSTGTGGHTAIEPIFTAGVGESETQGLNLCWFMGWIPASSKIGVDFEDFNSGLNHPLTGTTVLSNNVDYHICATYNHTSSAETGSWKVYINGVAEASGAISGAIGVRTPDTSSKQGVGIGVAITSAAARSGAFLGQISEVCMWNCALDAVAVSQLAKSRIKGLPLQISSSVLQGYWPLDETSDGATVSTTANAVLDKSGRLRNGTAFGTITGRAETVLSYP